MSATIIDGATGLVETGTWFDLGAGYGGDSRYAGSSGSPTATSTRTVTGLSAGVAVYVQITWLEDPNRATNTPWTIYDSDGTTVLASGTMNQQLVPDGAIVAGGFNFHRLARVTPTSTSLKVKLTNQADGFVIADAVRVVTATDVETGYVYTIHEHLDKIEVPGLMPWNGIRYSLTDPFIWLEYIADSDSGYFATCIVDITNATNTVELGQYWGTANSIKASVDGEAPTVPVSTNTTFLPATMYSNLSVGQHLIRFCRVGGATTYIDRIKVTGGTIISTANRQITHLNLSNFSTTSEASPITQWGKKHNNGVWVGPGADGFPNQDEFQVSGATAVLCGVFGNDAGECGVGVKLDLAQPDRDLALCPPGAIGDTYLKAVEGLDPSQSHTLRVYHPDFDLSAQRKWGYLLLAGTRLSASASATDTTISVESASGYATGQWIQIGLLEEAEIVQISGVSGTTLTVSALAKDHALHAYVTNWQHTQATASTWTEFNRTNKLLSAGNSNTEGVPGTDYSTYNHSDGRFPGVWRATDRGGWEQFNFALSGNTADAQCNIADNYDTYAPDPAQIYTTMIGQNDCTVNKTLDFFENGDGSGGLRGLFTKQTAHGGSGALYLYEKIQMKLEFRDGIAPRTVNSLGLNLTDYNNRALSVIADFVGDGYDFRFIDSCSDVDFGDPSETFATTDTGGHFYNPGAIKRGNNLIPFLYDRGKVVITGPVGGVYTVTRAAGTFNGVDKVTHAASAGTITATAAGGTITNNGTGTVDVKPAAGATSYTFAPSTAATITHTNDRQWDNPSATVYSGGPSVPDAPVLDAILGLEVGSTGILVEPTAPASDGGSAIISYKIYRKRIGINAAFVVAGTLPAASLGSHFLDTGTADGDTVDYYVTAVNAIGESAASATRETTSQGPHPTGWISSPSGSGLSISIGIGI